MSSAYLVTQSPALNQIGFDGFEGNASLLSPLFRDKAVVEILLQRPVFAKVDLHLHRAALLVGQELNTSHDVPLVRGSNHNLAWTPGSGQGHIVDGGEARRKVRHSRRKT